MSITRLKLENFFKDDERVVKLRQAVRLLNEARVFDLLREMGVPAVVGHGENTQAMAHQGSWSNGFNTCLNEIEHFELLHDERNS